MVEMHEGGYLYFKLQAPNLFTGLTLQNLQKNSNRKHAPWCAMQISGRRQVKIQVRIADSTSAFEGHIARPPSIATCVRFTLQHCNIQKTGSSLELSWTKANCSLRWFAPAREGSAKLKSTNS